MATTVYYCASSLDGNIAEADDSLDWLLHYQGAFEQGAAQPDPMGDGGGHTMRRTGSRGPRSSI